MKITKFYTAELLKRQIIEEFYFDFVLSEMKDENFSDFNEFYGLFFENFFKCKSCECLESKKALRPFETDGYCKECFLKERELIKALKGA